MRYTDPSYTTVGRVMEYNDNIDKRKRKRKFVLTEDAKQGDDTYTNAFSKQ